MVTYLIRRLILFPLTLLGIILTNFAIINLAPGDPVTVTEISPQGNATRRENSSIAFSADDRYLQFREHYGLTLPLFFNSWPYTSQQTVDQLLWQVTQQKRTPEDKEELPVKEYDALRIHLGDGARYIMPQLLHVVEDPTADPAIRRMASRFFARGATRQALVGAQLTPDQRQYNKQAAENNQLVRALVIEKTDSAEVMAQKSAQLRQWYESHRLDYGFEPSASQKIAILFLETRFVRYMSRVLTLDFGTLRNDDSKSVISEVIKRFKYSLTLAILPMLLTFIFCQIFGFLMAYFQNRWIDHSLNVLFLILYAIPIFVVAPFLIEEAIGRTFPFTDTPIPYSGFTSPERIYDAQVSYQRLFDILTHICLPLVAIMYGSLAVQSRISRTAVLEVLHQDYIRTAHAKGLSPFSIFYRHVGRNAGITVTTSIAGSLGIVLGGSLIVETLFDINGFGKFFYDAVLNWDYNVILFSALAGSFLTLLGYLVADIAYTLLDPRVTLD